MKYKRPGLTLVEILTVVAIIALLVGLLVPAVTTVRKMAKEASQKAQLTTIEMAITAFKNDYGDYPPSDENDISGVYYNGAQRLAEALVGLDLLGFHPDSVWRADGLDATGSINIYYPTGTQAQIEANLNRRKGPYLELATANVFKISDLFKNYAPLLDTFVICDMFGVRNVRRGNKNVPAGTPILYYKANTNCKTIDVFAWPQESLIYKRKDNKELAKLGSLSGAAHAAGFNETDVAAFYTYITDETASASGIPRPYRADSYLLITAGADGLYGTDDDITNFGN